MRNLRVGRGENIRQTAMLSLLVSNHHLKQLPRRSLYSFECHRYNVRVEFPNVAGAGHSAVNCCAGGLVQMHTQTQHRKHRQSLVLTASNPPQILISTFRIIYKADAKKIIKLMNLPML